MSSSVRNKIGIGHLAAIAGGLLLAVTFAIWELELSDNRIYLNYPISKWLLLVVLLVATPLLLSTLRATFCSTVRQWEKRQSESQRIGHDATRGLAGAGSLVLVALGWTSAIDFFELPRPGTLHQAAAVALIAGGTWFVLSTWEAVCQRIAAKAIDLDSRAERLLIPLIRKFVRGTILVAGCLIALSAFAVDWKGIVAGLGLGGLLVALAAKDSVENLFGSVTILFDMPFQIGDLVKVSGIEGTVEEINLRSTRIRTAEDAVVTLPNSNLIKASVENFGARRKRRQKLTMRTSYKSTSQMLDKLVADIRSYLGEQPWIVQENTTVEVNDLGETAISIQVLFFIHADSYLEEMNLRGKVITKCLSIAEGLGIAFLS